MFLWGRVWEVRSGWDGGVAALENIEGRVLCLAQEIFASYIEQMTGNRQTPAAPENPSTTAAVGGLGQDSLVLQTLQEISQKLDRFGNLPTGSAPAAPYAAQNVQGMVDIAITNGTIVLPDVGVFCGNLYLQNGKVVGMGAGTPLPARKVIDATGKHVLPGIIDPHTHFGLMAPLDTELVTETKSALMGGITTIGCFFGGPDSHLRNFPQVAAKIGQLSYTDFVPHLVIGTDEQRAEMVACAQQLGVTSFKIYMNGIPGIVPDVDDGFILDVFEEVKKTGKPCIVCAHAENRYLVRRADRMLKEQKPNATVAEYSDSHPTMAEEEAVIRLSYLAEKCGVEVYFVHMSSKEAIERLRTIRYKNKFVHVETTSPYLCITRQNITGNEFKMEPPFRDAEDVEQLWRALEDGVIDTIGTDNVTSTRAEKNADAPMWEAVPGYPAEETHLASLLSEGVNKRGMCIEKLVSHMTKKPAETFGIYPQKGTLMPGSDADVVIVDLNLTREVKASALHSRSDFSIFEGRRLQGWPITTIKGGQVVVENGQFVATAATGQCLSR